MIKNMTCKYCKNQTATYCPHCQPNQPTPESKESACNLCNGRGKVEVDVEADCPECKPESKEDWEDVFDLSWEKIGIFHQPDRDKIKSFIRSEKKKSELEALEMISDDMGWEESRDIYAEKLGLPKKYNLK